MFKILTMNVYDGDVTYVCIADNDAAITGYTEIPSENWGSTATSIETGATFILNSSGQWVKQGS